MEGALAFSVDQIRFHEHHPEYGEYWSPGTADASDSASAELADTPNSEQLPAQDVSDVPRTLQVCLCIMTRFGVIG